MAFKYLTENVLTDMQLKSLNYEKLAVLEIAHQLDRIADALEGQNKGLDNVTEELTRITHELKR